VRWPKASRRDTLSAKNKRCTTHLQGTAEGETARADSGMAKRTLIIQICILTFCLFAAAETVAHFPFPSPLIKPLLPPKLRWPADEVAAWVESGNVDSGFLAFFMRDPDRTIPSGRNLVSPSDGVIKDIVVQDGITYFVVGLSYWDVHVVRTPVAGVVKNIEQEGLSFYRHESETKEMAFLKGKAGPVQQIVTLDTDYGEIKVRLITSYWASRLKLWVHEGQQLEKGERIGRILLGSSVVVDLPDRVTFPVQVGEHVVGGETVIFDGDALP
jgi:phosphatidylserine decarboxylase